MKSSRCLYISHVSFCDSSLSVALIQGGSTKAETYAWLLKTIVIGNASTGKSSILARFTANKFKTENTHTIGVEFGSRIIDTGGKNVKLQVWDTAGQERFRSVTRTYYRGAAGCLIVYDITNRESYNSVAMWLNDARSLATPELVIVLVGNKSDLQEEREVSFLEASRFAQEHGLMFLETSAKTGESVEEAFMKCSSVILSKIESGKIKADGMGSGIQPGNASGRKVVKTKNPRITAGQNVNNDEGCAC